jgi:hypothetical protein
MAADPSRWHARCEYARKGLLFPISVSIRVGSGDCAAMLGLEKWSAVRERGYLSRSSVLFIRGKLLPWSAHLEFGRDLIESGA